MGIKLINYQYFFQTLVGTIMKNQIIDFSIIQDFFRGKINQIIKKQLSKYIINNKITYFEIDLHIDDIQKVFEEELRTELEQFGFDVINLSIESINVPEEDLAKLNDILHKKAEYEQLGDQVYRTTRGYDILEAGAENNGAAATMMGVGMGMNMAGNVTNNMGIIPPAKENDKKIKCPSCNNLIDVNSKFCPECGSKILGFCPECGSKIEAGQKFCSECGHKLY
jgi:membrane protease subunit (stomatin/prohibitin family)